MKKKICMVGIYSLIHFLVDMSCIILVLGKVSAIVSDPLVLLISVILYNFFAFAMQLPFGIYADKLNKNAYVSSIGCILVALAYAVFKLPMISCIIAGIGNALFHVGGGIDVLNISNKKASLPGIYVATGAFGLYIGQKFMNFFTTHLYVPILSLLCAACVLALVYKTIKEKWNVSNEVPDIKFTSSKTIMLILMLITVCMRGYVGLILSFDWKKVGLYGLLAILAVVGGKMLGGIIGDRIGWKKTALISLGIATILFNFAFTNWICGVIAILLFNMTMPITLTALSNTFNKAKGFAFGLTTIALFVGSIPSLLNIDLHVFTTIGLSITTIISVVALVCGLCVYDKEKLGETEC